jgi:cytochrome c-type biogenesis protein CcmE
MTRKRKRLIAVIGGLVLLGGAAAITLTALNDNLVFFYSPTDLTTKHVPAGRQLRIGGLVETGSVEKSSDGKSVSFRITDTSSDVAVHYTGALPDLFREGQGVVVEGAREADGSIQAANVLAKHDERYMPPEVVEALKKQGRWQEGAAMPDAKKPPTPTLPVEGGGRKTP